MARKYASTETFTAGTEEMREHIATAFKANKIILLDRDTRALRAMRSKTLGVSRSGENLSVQIVTNGSRSAVTIESKLTFALIDRGRNQRNVEAVFASLRSQLA